MSDTEHKIVIGWSAKCGCTHIKRIWLYLTHGVDITGDVHNPIPARPPPPDIHNYTMLIVARNPYERLVSGFLDKYGQPGKIRDRWPKHIPLTFSNFVAALARNDRSAIERHHIGPQTGEKFDLLHIRRAKRLVVCDISNVDYSILEQAFGKKIPQEMIEWHGTHARKTAEPVADPLAPMRTVDELNRATLRISDMYSPPLTETVARVFAHDLQFFAEHGLRYRPP